MSEGNEEASPIPQPSERIVKDSKVLLFRYENPNIPNPNPNGSTSRQDLIGKWFVDNPKSLKSYILMRPPGGEIVIVAIPETELANLHVNNHPIAKDMDVEGDNYIIPDTLLQDARRINFDVQPSNPKKFLFGPDMPKIRNFIDNLVETEKSR